MPFLLAAAPAAAAAGGAAATGAAAAGTAAAAGAATAAGTAASAGAAASLGSSLATWGGYAATALSVLSPVLSGMSDRSAASQNASSARTEAAYARMSAQAEADRTRRINDATQAKFRAQAGHQGTLFEGSPMLAYLENAKQSELEAQDALYAGTLRSSALKQQASAYKQKGNAALIAGLTKGAFSLGSSLMKG